MRSLLKKVRATPNPQILTTECSPIRIKRKEKYHWFDELIINGHIDNADAVSIDIVSKSVNNISTKKINR